MTSRARARALPVLALALAGLLAGCGSDDADTADAPPTPDRTVRFDAVDFTYQDLELEGIEAGDTIRFEMANSGDQAHEFEVLDPSGEAVGEVEATEPGEEGSATITFGEAGTYGYQCILVDEATDQPHTEMGMTGEFEVADAG